MVIILITRDVNNVVLIVQSVHQQLFVVIVQQVTFSLIDTEINVSIIQMLNIVHRVVRMHNVDHVNQDSN